MFPGSLMQIRLHIIILTVQEQILMYCESMYLNAASTETVIPMEKIKVSGRGIRAVANNPESPK